MLPVRLPPQSFFSDSESPIVVPQKNKRNSLTDSPSKLLQLAKKMRKESSNMGNTPSSLSECESSPDSPILRIARKKRETDQKKKSGKIINPIEVMSFTAFSLHSLDESDNTTPNLSPQFNEFKEENKEEKMFINIPSLISSNSNPICFQTIKEVDAFNEVSPKFVYDKGRNDVHSWKSDPDDNQTMSKFVQDHNFRHLVFSNKISDTHFKKHLLITYKGARYSLDLAQPDDEYRKNKAICLNQLESKKKTLVLDLDETLIHTCNVRENPEYILNFNEDRSKTIEIGLNIRPYCRLFFEKVSKYFEIVIFTASTKDYAELVLNFLRRKHFKINKDVPILDKSNCFITKKGFIIKDLQVLSNRKLQNLAILDNLAYSYGLQLSNGIPIVEWHSDKNDTELLGVLKYLKKLSKCDDVRKFNDKNLRLRDLASLRIENLGL